MRGRPLVFTFVGPGGESHSLVMPSASVVGRLGPISPSGGILDGSPIAFAVRFARLAGAVLEYRNGSLHFVVTQRFLGGARVVNCAGRTYRARRAELHELPDRSTMGEPGATTANELATPDQREQRMMLGVLLDEARAMLKARAEAPPPLRPPIPDMLGRSTLILAVVAVAIAVAYLPVAGCLSVAGNWPSLVNNPATNADGSVHWGLPGVWALYVIGIWWCYRILLPIIGLLVMAGVDEKLRLGWRARLALFVPFLLAWIAFMFPRPQFRPLPVWVVSADGLRLESGAMERWADVRNLTFRVDELGQHVVTSWSTEWSPGENRMVSREHGEYRVVSRKLSLIVSTPNGEHEYPLPEYVFPAQFDDPVQGDMNARSWLLAVSRYAPQMTLRKHYQVTAHWREGPKESDRWEKLTGGLCDPPASGALSPATRSATPIRPADVR